MSHLSQSFAKAILGAAVLAAAAAPSFAATEARPLLVTATIPGGCTLTTTPMAFGILNVAGTADETKTATATIKCALGVSASGFAVGGITTGTFTGSMAGSATTQTMAYTITWTDPGTYTGQGFATGKDVSLLGTIKNAEFVAKSPDNFSQSVIVSINF